ncbi:MAG: DUF2800 domain-containing protein [Clostridia bacterium]|nr:DUF2800 domain-containing protein [Clostridia bacterium]
MPDTHALLSPSSSDRWLHCPASARLAETITGAVGSEETPYAKRGTVLHDLAAKNLQYKLGQVPQDTLHEAVEAADLTPEESTMITKYVDIVMQKYGTALAECPSAQLFIESRFDMDAWAPECFGTGDAVIVTEGWIEVIDLKTGSGVYVNAIGNSQLRLYALGAYDAYGSLFEIGRVRTTIVQPALDNISSEDLFVEDVLSWGESVKDPAKKAHKGMMEFSRGAWCRFCPALPVCPAQICRMTKVIAPPEQLSKTRRKTVSGIDAEKIVGMLGAMYDGIHAAEEYLSKTKKLALRFAEAGYKIPGYSVGKRGLRRDTADDDFADLTN